LGALARESDDVTDARTLNWRFVVPDEPPGLLFLPTGPGPGPVGLAAALAAGPYPAVAVTDLGSWARRRPAEAGRTLARLSAAVAPGGWLCAGFANASYPGTPPLVGALRIQTARRILRRAGLSDPEVYFALPHQRCPALLVPAARPVELDHVLRQLFLTYVPSDGAWAMAQRYLLAAFRRGALLTPHLVRTLLAPGFYVVARRPG
jgi:hypothetical protein